MISAIGGKKGICVDGPCKGEEIMLKRVAIGEVFKVTLPFSDSSYIEKIDLSGPIDIRTFTHEYTAVRIMDVGVYELRSLSLIEEERKAKRAPPHSPTMAKAVEWAISRILDMVAKNFYGDITLKFEGGKLVHMEHRTSEKPPREKQ